MPLSARCFCFVYFRLPFVTCGSGTAYVPSQRQFDGRGATPVLRTLAAFFLLIRGQIPLFEQNNRLNGKVAVQNQRHKARVQLLVSTKHVMPTFPTLWFVFLLLSTIFMQATHTHIMRSSRGLDFYDP